MTEDNRSIELEIEVPGTPEQVWQAIATGPGISSWYVPHEVEEQTGGAMSASFGEGPEMQVQGKVGVWDPPNRAVFHGEDPDEGLVFEWLVEARDGGTCIVRLVNSGFGRGGEWDDHYDAMYEGWQLFLSNLRLHLEHFAGRMAHPNLPMAVVGCTVDVAWQAITARLGIPADAAVGDRVVVDGQGAPELAGTVAEIMNVRGTPLERRVLLVLDQPAPGTAFVAAENHGPMTAVSIWTYLYEDEGAAAGERDAPIFQELLDELAAAFNS